jgi:regulator of protease activity HflC (stomatin/prohibitin superfamily)
MQQAMEEQAAAERARRAMVTRAEGEKASAILQAEGKLEASKREAQAKIVLAEGDKNAIAKIAEAAATAETTLHYLLGQRYVDALRALAEQQGSRTVVLPADLTSAIQGLLGGGKR